MWYNLWRFKRNYQAIVLKCHTGYEMVIKFPKLFNLNCKIIWPKSLRHNLVLHLLSILNKASVLYCVNCSEMHTVRLKTTYYYKMKRLTIIWCFLWKLLQLIGRRYYNFLYKSIFRLSRLLKCWDSINSHSSIYNN